MLIKPFIRIRTAPIIIKKKGRIKYKLKKIKSAIKMSIIPPISKKEILAFKKSKTIISEKAPVCITPPIIEKRTNPPNKSTIPKNFTI